MNNVVLWKLVDLALNAVAVGFERQEVIAKLKAMEAEGKSPDELAAALKTMRDEALAKLG